MRAQRCWLHVHFPCEVEEPTRTGQPNYIHDFRSEHRNGLETRNLHIATTARQTRTNHRSK